MADSRPRGRPPSLSLPGRYAKAIRFFRDRALLSQAQVARRMHVTQGFLCHLESGRRSPSVETLHKLAAALGVTAARIVAEVEAPNG